MGRQAFAEALVEQCRTGQNDHGRQHVRAKLKNQTKPRRSFVLGHRADAQDKHDAKQTQGHLQKTPACAAVHPLKPAAQADGKGRRRETGKEEKIAVDDRVGMAHAGVAARRGATVEAEKQHRVDKCGDAEHQVSEENHDQNFIECQKC